ncbi:MAG TPA: amino acid adenylation domain-containing protein [Pirellulales bacterium]|jgi:amino acid adenylation domain-containing protein/non-ribosomal peptide synthase protein (TIGR01720 family)
MKLENLLYALWERRIRLTADHGRLRYEAPTGAVTPDLLEALRHHKLELTVLYSEGGDAVDIYPLSHAQLAVWAAHQVSCSGLVYNLGFAATLQPGVELAQFARAFSSVVERHASLRTVFSVIGETPIQRVLGRTAHHWQIHSGEMWHAGEFEQWFSKELSTPFNLICGPLVRAGVVTRAIDADTGMRRDVFFMFTHHLIMDFRALELVLADLAAVYGSRATDANDGSPLKAPSHAIFEERQWMQTEEAREQLRFWSARPYADATTLPLACMAKAVDEGVCQSDGLEQRAVTSVGSVLPTALTESIRSLAREVNSTPFLVVLSALMALMRKFDSGPLVTIGVPTLGRHSAVENDIVGYFVNPVPVSIDIADSPTFLVLLERARKSLGESLDYSRYPLSQWVTRTRETLNDMSWFPFKVVLAWDQRTRLLAGENLADTPFERVLRSDQHGPEFPLTIAAADYGSKMEITVRFDPTLVRTEQAEKLVCHLQTVLGQAVGDPGIVVSEITLSTPDEALAVRAAENGGNISPHRQTVLEWFEATRRAFPDRAAIVTSTSQWTFCEFDARANGVAHALREAGIRPGMLVPLVAHRSAEWVAGVLGILKAGGAYVPLDPNGPHERLSRVLSGISPRAIVAVSSFAPWLRQHFSACVVCPDEAPPENSLPLTEASSSPNDLIYVIYTSGSTGEPKGAMIRHNGFCNLVDWYCREFKLDASDRFFVITSPVFDLTQKNIFAGLVLGATVVIDEGTEFEPVRLVSSIQKWNITVLNCTPSMFEALLDASSHDLKEWSSLRYVFLGGEPVRPMPRCANRTASQFHAIIVNTYGPTECSDVCAFHRIESDELLGTNSVPIGRPVQNTQLLILDADGRRCAPGVAGELWIGGVGIGAGYVGDQSMTGERFVSREAGDGTTPQFYRSGDLVRRRSDGNIDFVSRMDDQVKLRGYRVDLAAIEAVLRRHPSVKAAAVTVQNRGSTGGVTAHVVTQGGHPFDPRVLQETVGAQLPAYMVPSVVVQLQSLPMLPSGKVNRAALARSVSIAREVPFEIMTPNQEILAQIWSKFLNVPSVSLDDSFFELGGDSLMAIRLCHAIDVQLGCHVTMEALHRHPTIRLLAGHLGSPQSVMNGDGGNSAAGFLATLPSSAPAGGWPLSFAQERMWFLEQLGQGQAGRGGAYNVGICVRLRGSDTGAAVGESVLDERRLGRALAGLWVKHEALRTVLVPDGRGSARQQALDAGPAEVAELLAGVERRFGLRGHDAADRSDAAEEQEEGWPRRFMPWLADLSLSSPESEQFSPEQRFSAGLRLVQADVQRAYDLLHGPLFRAGVARLGPADHLLYLGVHHAVCDEWSIGLLLRDLVELYHRDGRGETGQTFEPSSASASGTVRYMQFAAWERQRLGGGSAGLEQGLAYWRETLSGLTPLELPEDRPSSLSGQGGAGGMVAERLDRAVAVRLVQLGRRHGTTWFMTLLAGFVALLHRYSRTGQWDVAVGTPVSTRESGPLQEAVGLFLNTVVLRTRLRPHDSFADLLGRVRGVCLGAYVHQAVPLEQVVQQQGAGGVGRRDPLFRVMFTVQQEQQMAEALRGLAPSPPGLSAQVVPLSAASPGASKFDLTLTAGQPPAGTGSGADLASADEGVELQMEYDAGLFDESTVRQMLANLCSLLDQATRHPDRPLERLEFLDERERQTLLRWGAGERGLLASGRPQPRPMHEWFSQIATGAPQTIAVQDGNTVVTYRELDCRSNRLARKLHGHGVGPGVLVGLCMRRSAELVVSLLAVWKAGGAYVPLDPSYPAERLNFMISDAGAKVIVIDANDQSDSTHTVVKQATADGRLIVRAQLISDEVLSGGDRDADLAMVFPDVHLDDPCYVIYTSASTGRAKGVVITHRALENYLRWSIQAYGLSDFASQEGRAFGAVVSSSWSADLTVTSLLGGLLSGAGVELMADGDIVTMLAARIAAGAEYGLVKLTPSHMELLTHALGSDLAGCRVKRMIIGGENLLPRHVLPWMKYAKKTILINEYGPTEATVGCAIYEVVGSDRRWIAKSHRPIPVGKPISGMTLYVVDRRLQLLPIGVPGELVIGGIGLARGYHGRPDLTVERFVPDPFAGGVESGSRLYRSGDLARFLPDGNLEILGRIDQQVKIRGFRIEPSEVEAAILEHPSIRSAAVCATLQDEQTCCLIGCVTDDGGVTESELTAYLRRKLPLYMVPDRIFKVPELPLAASGKLDVKAVQRMLAQAAPATPAVMPSTPVGTPTELMVSRVWSSVLGSSVFSINDNFFDVGGHSLLLVRLQEQLQNTLNRRIPLAVLFEKPTIARLADWLDSQNSAEPMRSKKRRHRRQNARWCSESDSVAVVGMSCRFPGAANTEAFWTNLANAVESLSRFSAGEMAAAGVASHWLADPRYVSVCGVVDESDLFDPAFFGFTLREASLADPQQRIFLECAWRALEDGGIDPVRPPGSIGVFGGMSASGHWLRLAGSSQALSEFGVLEVMIGGDKDFLTARTAYKLNLRGPAITIQTGCSTSLVAIHHAVQSLRRGETDVALAGGVCIRTPQRVGYIAEVGSTTSPSGHCRAFDAGADGLVPGNGAGVVVLMRLRDAVAQGRQIYAVIRGTAVNNDGAGKVGFTAPSVDAQAEVIHMALRDAGLKSRDVSYVEAHGTGTKLGDLVEVTALRKVFDPRGTESPCFIGSVKTNIGHLDTAAGVAGFIKAVLSLSKERLPASLHYHGATPEMGLIGSGLAVNASLREWPRVKDEPRRSGVHVYGIGGTNAHVILEEAPERPREGKPSGPQLLPISAQNPTTFESLRSDLVEYFERSSTASVDLADVASTLQFGRSHRRFRMALIARDLEDVLSQLGDSARKGAPIESRSPLTVIFACRRSLGATWPFSRELYDRYSPVRSTIDRCCTRLPAGHRAAVLNSLIGPRKNISCFPDYGLLDFISGLAVARLFRHFGVRHKGVVCMDQDSSLALVLNGSLTLEQGLDRLLDRPAYAMAPASPGARPVSLPTWHTLNESSGSLAEWLVETQHVVNPLVLFLPGIGPDLEPSRTDVNEELILRMAGTLWEQGVELNWQRIRARPARFIGLPPHPLQRTRVPEALEVQQTVAAAGKEEQTAFAGVAASEGAESLKTPRLNASESDPCSINFEHGNAALDHWRNRDEKSAALQIAAVFADVIGLESFGAEDDIHKNGIDSLAIIRIATRLGNLGFSVTSSQITQCTSAAKLAAILITPGNVSPHLPAEASPLTPIPLVPIQHWFFDRGFIDPGNYNACYLFQISDSLSTDGIRTAVKVLMMHHEALRLRFYQSDQGWRQTVAPEGEPISVEEIDLVAVAPEQQWETLIETARRLRSSLDICKGPLARFTVIKTSARGRVLVVVLSHLAVDAISIDILANDLCAACDQVAAGITPRLLPPTASFRQFADALVEYSAKPAARANANWWIWGAWDEVRPIPRDFNVPDSVNTYAALDVVQWSRSRLHTDAELVAAGISEPELLVAACAAALADWTHADAVAIDLTAHGRVVPGSTLDLSRTVGYVTTNVPVLLKVQGGGPVSVTRAVALTLRSLPNSGIDYGVVRYLQPDTVEGRALRSIASPEVKFNYHGRISAKRDNARLLQELADPVRDVLDTSNRRAYTINIECYTDIEMLHFVVRYSRALHRRESIERFGYRIFAWLERWQQQRPDPERRGEK